MSLAKHGTCFSQLDSTGRGGGSAPPSELPSQKKKQVYAPSFRRQNGRFTRWLTWGGGGSGMTSPSWVGGGGGIQVNCLVSDALFTTLGHFSGRPAMAHLSLLWSFHPLIVGLCCSRCSQTRPNPLPSSPLPEVVVALGTPLSSS